jgi:putative GTP pyrophosphokinase
MAVADLTNEQRRIIRDLVSHYEEHREAIFGKFLDILLVHITGDPNLKEYIHSVKMRTKAPGHLKDKLSRKFRDANKNGKKVKVTKDNLFTTINDLAGFRILHLHTGQFEYLHKGLLGLFARERYVLRGKPFARTWDDESRGYFKEIGIKTEKSPSMYTSVHYVISSQSRVAATCEIQVRTLMEEVWGEVSHTVNYPHEVRSVACKEQIATLARVTSSATRLVDSIFRSYDDHERVTRATAELRRRLRP